MPNQTETSEAVESVANHAKRLRREAQRQIREREMSDFRETLREDLDRDGLKVESIPFAFEWTDRQPVARVDLPGHHTVTAFPWGMDCVGYRVGNDWGWRDHFADALTDAEIRPSVIARFFSRLFGRNTSEVSK